MKYPFTPTGVEDKLKDLYVLTDELLFDEASSIELDFASWMQNNFTLTTAQVEYLNDIKQEARNYYGSQCAFCFRHRLDIILIYPTQPPGYAKLPETTNTIKIIADDSGNMEVTGALTFTMIYRPLT